MSALTRRAARPEPWRVGDVTVVSAGLFVGGAGLGVAWFGISGTTDLGHQVVWLDAGVVALLVGSAACACWLLSGHRAVRTRSRVLQSALGARRGVTIGLDGGAHVAADHDAVAVAAGTRFHRPTCQLVAGRVVLTGSTPHHVAAGRAPCGVCEPLADVDP